MYEQEGGRVASSAKPSPIVSITMPAAHGRTEIDAFADSRRCGDVCIRDEQGAAVDP